MQTVTATTCVSCGAPLTARFCGECGEMRAELRHETLGHFIGHTFVAFTHLDGTFPRTLKTLLLQPGELTLEYLRGRRKPYLGPLQLFLAVNVVFFILQSRLHASVLNTPLRFHLDSPYGGLARRLTEGAAAARQIDPAAYAEHFDHMVGVLSHSLVIVMAPLLALLLALFLRPRRQFVPHLVFAIHFYAFWMIALCLLLGGFPLLARLTGLSGSLGPATVDALSSLLMLAASALYLRVAFKRACGLTGWRATLAALGYGIALIAILILYRMILFFAVYWAA